MPSVTERETAGADKWPGQAPFYPAGCSVPHRVVGESFYDQAEHPDPAPTAPSTVAPGALRAGESWAVGEAVARQAKALRPAARGRHRAAGPALVGPRARATASAFLRRFLLDEGRA